MPTQRDEFAPDADFLALLASSVIQPRLASFESDGCPPLVALYVSAVLDQLNAVGTVAAHDNPDSNTNGEIRVRVRQTGNPARVVWCIESLFPNIMPSTGFVGFDQRGDAQIVDNVWSIRTDSWVGKYNVADWHGWS